MALVNTNLFIQMAQIPPTFKGTPQQLSVEMIKRMRIVSPNGVNFIYIGDVEPTSNVGPWLKGGTQWWVWDDSTNRYKPQDLSASFTSPYAIGNSTPTVTDPPLWLKTTADATDLAPNSYGDPLGWYLFDGTAWIPFNSLVNSGATAARPSAPADFEQFYDTDINALIWWERSAWRTVSGVPGDLKFVTFQTATQALTANPGWSIFAASTPGLAGRALVQATQDPGATPVTQLATSSGVNSRAAYSTSGDGPQQLQVNNLSTLVLTPDLALWCLVKN
jgi:hypothetical protein